MSLIFLGCMQIKEYAIFYQSQFSTLYAVCFNNYAICLLITSKTANLHFIQKADYLKVLKLFLPDGLGSITDNLILDKC